MHQDTWQKEEFDRSLGQTYLLVLESLLERQQGLGGDGCNSPWGHGHWLQTFWGAFSCMSTATGGCWTHPTACRCQCWDTSGQTTNCAGRQPHPSANRMPKDFLSPQPPLDMPLDMALPTRGPRPSSTHQWAGARSKKTMIPYAADHQQQVRPYPGTRWALALPISRPT